MFADIRFTLRTVFIFLAACSCLFAIIHHAHLQHAELERRQFEGVLRSIGMTLLWHLDDHRQLPHSVQCDAAGKPLYSWRFMILKYDQGCGDISGTRPLLDLESYRNKPWNDSQNVFHSMRTNYTHQDSESLNTNILAIVGPGTAFGDENSRQKDANGLEGTAIDVITGNANDAILAVEVRKSGVHWMEPRDLDIRTMPRTINHPSGRGISSCHKGGFHVLFADGEVWFLRNNTPFDELAKFLTIEGARSYDKDNVLGQYCIRATNYWDY